MAIKGKCRVCGKNCENFYIQNGRTLCDNCFLKLANKAVKYRLKINRLNALLLKSIWVLCVCFAFVCGLAVGQWL